MPLLSWLGIQTAWAAGSGQSDQGGILSVLPLLILFFVVFYFLLIRPQNKRAREHRELLANLSQDDEVVTSGGLIGRISQLDDNFITLQVASNVDVVVQKQAISSQMPKGTLESF